MISTQQPPVAAGQQAERPVSAGKGLKFGSNNEFQSELRRRVDDYFRTTGKPQRDCPQMYLKTAILITSFVAAYATLVFAPVTWWMALPLAVLLGLITAGIGFNVQHDGGHQAYSSRPWINKICATTLDFIGGSSYLWHYKHGVFHHTYANIAGHDTDIDMGVLGRVSPHQPHYWFHKWQHIYLWPLYGFMAIKWHLVDDFKDAITGKIGGHHKVPRPKGWNLAVFIGGKLGFFAIAFGIPMIFHPFWTVVLYYAVAAIVLGVVLSLVFQLAHCVEEAEFALPHGTPERIDNAWAVHQTEASVDFARDSRMAAWLLGGLNFQIEHHLFPRICHINFPEISKIVEETCKEYGVRYTNHGTFRAGVASHYRWLKQMGKGDKAATESDGHAGAGSMGAGSNASPA